MAGDRKVQLTRTSYKYVTRTPMKQNRTPTSRPSRSSSSRRSK